MKVKKIIFLSFYEMENIAVHFLAAGNPWGITFNPARFGIHRWFASVWRLSQAAPPQMPRCGAWADTEPQDVHLLST